MRAWLLLLVLGLLAGPAAWPAEPGFVVVMPPGSGEHRLPHETVARVFLRKQLFWANGQRIQPVNLPAHHPLRRAFSLSLLGGTPELLEDYWRDMYFHGVLPPHVLASEEAVALFVAGTPGAIGYLSTCAAAQNLSVVLVVGDPPGCPKQAQVLLGP